MQKIYWTMLGELKDLLAMELTGKDGGPVETVNTISLDRLSLEETQTIWRSWRKREREKVMSLRL